MKKTLKHTLAILLALLVVLTAGGVAASAAPAPQAAPPRGPVMQAAETLEILTPPTDPCVVIDRWGDRYGTPDLSGMEFRAGGGDLAATVDVSYDTVMSDAYIKTITQGKLNWYFYVYLDWDTQPDGWVVGDNDAILVVYATKYDNFVVEYTDPGGTEYGYYEQVYVYYAETALTVRAEADADTTLDFSSAVELKLNIAGAVSIPEPPEDEDTDLALFKFTPDADGYYIFRSQGAQPYREFYNREGEWLTLPGVHPYAALYDESGFWMDYASGYDGDDFSLRTNLRGGKTYYLAASAWPFGDYTVTVSKFDAVLKVNSEYVIVNYHDFLDLEALLAGTTWDIYDDLYFSYDHVTLQRFGYSRFCGIQNGTGWMRIYAPDGTTVNIRYKVTYSFKQWLCVIFLGGWYWMRWTEYGPFNLKEQWQALMDTWGLKNAIFDVLSDFGFPYWMISWLLK